MNPDASANPGRFPLHFDVPCGHRRGGQHDRRSNKHVHALLPLETPRSPHPDLTTRVGKGQAETRRKPPPVRTEAGVDGGAETGARRGNDSSDFQRLRKTCRSRGDSELPRVPDESSPRAGSRTLREPERRVPCAGCPSASRTGRHCPWTRATPETKHAASASSRTACSVLMRFLDRGAASRKTPPRSPGVLNRKLSISDAVYSW